MSYENFNALPEFDDDAVEHYGTPRHSGRYPYGSGENPYQHESWFKGFKYDTYRDMKKEGMSEKDICDAFGISSTDLRKLVTLGKSKQLQIDMDSCNKLYKKGYKTQKISEMTGIPETTVRSYINAEKREKAKAVDNIADILKEQLAQPGKTYLDVGKYVEKTMGISRSKLNAALEKLKEEGYTINTIQVEQVTNPSKYTTITVLGPEGTTGKDIHDNIGELASVADFTSDDGGNSFRPRIQYPTSLDSKRVYVRYDEDGGSLRDGTIEIRPGVDDLSLGGNLYAQVRICVDGDKYMKGMAFYSDDIPEGYDIVYNSNKSVNNPSKVFKAMNKIKDAQGNETDVIDETNPFGATIASQRMYTDKNGEQKLSPVNIIHEEGDWDDYNRNLSAQFLSKQPLKLIKQQLKYTEANKKAEYEDIMSIENPTIRKKLLEGFAEDCDKAAVDLRADDIAGQSFKVILPANTLKDNECYCSEFENGTTVALVRYPHSGIFEIPVLKVNNKNQESNKMLKNAADAIAINHNTAQKLSGADFDGDFVMVIPFSEKVKIDSSKYLKDLKGWDNKMSELYERPYKTMTEQTKGIEMGKITNLIMDMTLFGAPEDEMARAVKYSMVVIDAYKHQYDWQQASKDLDIKELRVKWQGKAQGGSGTLITRAKSPVDVEQRKVYNITKDSVDEEGYKINTPTGRMKWNSRTNKMEPVTQESYRMAETKDPYSLISTFKHDKEYAYADFASSMKSLANEARKSYLAIDDYKIDPDAKKKYDSEVKSINMKLDLAVSNPPRERQAQVIATSMLNDMKAKGTKLPAKEYKKQKDKALNIARNLVGSSKKAVQIHLTDDEWEAVEKHAIGSSKLNDILKNMDDKELRTHAINRNTNAISKSKQALIATMRDAGFDIAKIADRLGVSETTVKKYMKG